jgi:hypothetical protein
VLVAVLDERRRLPLEDDVEANAGGVLGEVEPQPLERLQDLQPERPDGETVVVRAQRPLEQRRLCWLPACATDAKPSTAFTLGCSRMPVKKYQSAA